ncbi:hypothetical protein Xen7305DRAFT_00048280 [Xenococcus sp. PCC 7305]|uniref:hypothetical protein n=1 Tax=Xenococcus sp. PCC 7305 TaxID=102125 RepID=UPI0002AC1986|nr:hypothetical protein [Xenococcus sp. PCC 7305]ELS05089.1 hypothetical protein Xen7305DRAFT_00048280 [Xenococcus sp. PCC 7305]
MSIELITVIAGVVITWLVFTWFIKVFQASIKTALTIAVILFCLQMFFGIRSQQVWQELTTLVRELLVRFLN